MYMILVARALERVGDNAVDIAEQVAFVVTGLFREYADAPDPRAPFHRGGNSHRAARACVCAPSPRCRPGGRGIPALVGAPIFTAAEVAARGSPRVPKAHVAN